MCAACYLQSRLVVTPQQLERKRTRKLHRGRARKAVGLAFGQHLFVVDARWSKYILLLFYVVLSLFGLLSLSASVRQVRVKCSCA